MKPLDSIEIPDQPRKNNNCSEDTTSNEIKTKLLNDSTFNKDYCACIQNIIDKGYAGPCEDQQAGWYIPHFGLGLYHPAKNKTRVLFDCSAKNQGVYLNDQLVQGPDLTNRLIGLLMRF